MLQSYLYRTEADLERLLPLTPNLRIVKGAYLEPPEIAYPEKDDVDRSFVRLVERMLSAGGYVAVATHDEAIIDRVKSFVARARDRPRPVRVPDAVRRARRPPALPLAEGYKVLVATPYGPDWYPYLMRRLAERPANLGFFLRNAIRRVTLPSSADVVVIGGGVIGTSAAFHLAEAGSRGSVARAGGARIRLDEQGGGWRAGAVLRPAQHRDRAAQPGGVRALSRATGRRDRPASCRLPVPARPRGGRPCIRALGRAPERARRAKPLRDARRGCDASPLAGLDGVVAATFSPYDGHAAPEAVVLGYAAGARAHGATVVTGCEVTGIALEAARSGRHTTLGEVATGTVICCAGAWSRAVGELVGVELPVEPVWREITYTAPVPGLPTRMPLTIDFSTGFYFHREGPGLLFGMGDRAQPAGFDAPTDPDWLLQVIVVAERRCPRLPDLGLAGGWKGYYDVSPDHNALVGEAPEAALPLRNGVLGSWLPARPGDG